MYTGSWDQIKIGVVYVGFGVHMLRNYQDDPAWLAEAMKGENFELRGPLGQRWAKQKRSNKA